VGVSSGAGPFAVAVSTAALSTTAETVIATITGSWNDPTGNLVTADFNVTATGAATLTTRIRQGSLTGTQVTGSTAIETFAGAATTVNVGGGTYADTSSFATTPGTGTYVLTAQASVSSTITPTGGVFELETMAPVQ
jgi:hypothetical protein